MTRGFSDGPDRKPHETPDALTTERFRKNAIPRLASAAVLIRVR